MKVEVGIFIYEYLLGVLINLPEEIIGLIMKPEDKPMFTMRVNIKQVLLHGWFAQTFNHALEHLLLRYMRCNKATQTVVKLLTTQERTTFKDAWKKLKQLLQYIKFTI